MCLAESLFCSNNILNTAFIYIYIKSKQKILEKNPKGPTGPNSRPKNQNWPKNRPKPKQIKTNGFSTISISFDWDFYKSKISVSVDQIKKTDRTEPITTLLCMALLFCSWETWLPTREWLLLVCVVCMLPSWSCLRSRLRKSSCRWEPMGSCWWGLDPTIVDCCTHYYTSSSHRRCQL